MRKRLIHHSNTKLTKLPILIGFAFLIYSMFVLYIGTFWVAMADNSLVGQSEVRKAVELPKQQWSFAELKTYFKKLAIEKGAVNAFEVLNKEPMPNGTDMHLLAHAVGDELYHQYGASGIKYCTQDFRNACSHSIVINLFYDKGEAALKEIVEACKQAPGDGGYDMCYHGLGHGVFAYSNYDLKRTVELCKKTATREHHESEFSECVGGAVMEQISGGEHDRDNWLKMRLVNLHKDDPLYPCMGSLIQDAGPRKICLIYLTPYLWEYAGKISADPTEDIIKNSFKYCDAIPLEDADNRDGCFGGFGKEFVPMARGHDIRNIDKLSDLEIKQVYDNCFLTDIKDGQKSCVQFALGSIYWSGAVDKKHAEHFCFAAPNLEFKEYCFSKLIDKVGESNKGMEYNSEFCSEIPISQTEECRNKLAS